MSSGRLRLSELAIPIGSRPSRSTARTPQIHLPGEWPRKQSLQENNSGNATQLNPKNTMAPSIGSRQRIAVTSDSPCASAKETGHQSVVSTI